MLKHGGVGLLFDKLEGGSSAPDIVFVGCAETVVPVKRFLENRSAQLGE